MVNFSAELDRLESSGDNKKPHRYLLLLTVMYLIRDGAINDNRIYYNDALKRKFSSLLSVYGEDGDRNRPCNPFFHLRRVSFWKLIPNPEKSEHLNRTVSIHGPGMLEELVHHAEIDRDLVAIINNSDEFSLMESEIIGRIQRIMLSRRTDMEECSQVFFKRIGLDVGCGLHANPFVGYLNSLQQSYGSNENALAEYQACNSSFGMIHVRHPLTKRILEELQDPAGMPILLTGHAGDGKSTIALDVFKDLLGLAAEDPLPTPLRPREDLPGSLVTILKDLSERRPADDSALIQELLSNARRFLIVSNTGALLDLLRSQALLLHRSPDQVESDVLAAIGDDHGQGVLELGGLRFLVFNLARIDNLELARAIFERMIDPERWAACEGRGCRGSCPIQLNLDLIRSRQELVLDRLFLAYRRIYEYGTRLTLRQLTEHLAYLITAGLEEEDISRLRELPRRPLQAGFWFFNRFFGDNGSEEDFGALQMRAVREVRQQRFGERPCPTWERKLWLKQRDADFDLGVPGCKAEFDLLRRHGSKQGADCRPGMTPDQAREQVRRMLYFLYEFDEQDTGYLCQYLNSPSLLRWRLWQQPDPAAAPELGMQDRNLLEQQVYQVLQEQFTGVRLPEGARGSDRRLYITLSRGKNEVRQSAQVVLAQIDWSNETSLELVEQANVAGGRRVDLVLCGRGRIQGADLALTLPFLDYVAMRHTGEVGETLQAAYVTRLEQFKARLAALAREPRSQVMLVRLRTDLSFRRQQYAVRNGKLEVVDVL